MTNAFHNKQKRRIKPGERVRPDDILFVLFALLFAALIIYPFYNAVMISVVPMSQYIRDPFVLWPRGVTWDSYRFVFNYHSIWIGLRNTSVVTVVGTSYNMLLTVLTAYTLTKSFPGKKLIQYMIIFTMYFSGGLVPYYLLVRSLGLINKIGSMILPTGLQYTYVLIVMRYIENLAAELEEAAEIDGASSLQKLFIIVLPLSLPILATYTLYYGVDRWNEWWNGMLFIKSTHLQPLQLILRNLVQDSTNFSADAQENGLTEAYSDAIKMAGIIVTMIPILFLYPFLQRYFLSDLTVGAVKG